MPNIFRAAQHGFNSQAPATQCTHHSCKHISGTAKGGAGGSSLSTGETRCAAHLGEELIGVHCQAHGASRLAPVEAGLDENLIQALSLSLLLDDAGARHHLGEESERAGEEEGIETMRGGTNGHYR